MLTKEQEDARCSVQDLAKGAHLILVQATEVAACNHLWGLLEKVLKAREATSVIYPPDLKIVRKQPQTAPEPEE